MIYDVTMYTLQGCVGYAQNTSKVRGSIPLHKTCRYCRDHACFLLCGWDTYLHEYCVLFSSLYLVYQL